MSFKQNDTNDNNMIHLGNYEEYFILYMDNELSDDQMKMVDDFLSKHPDLQGEFELLMSTRLPMEEFSFSKEELLSDKMKFSAVDEELLLYVDNELPAEQKKIIDLELKRNKDYQLQHQLLMRSKLDASEKVLHPNKKELYRKEERRVIAFRPWMRIAAAVMVIAAAGVLYFTNSSKPHNNTNSDLASNNNSKNEQPIAKENRDQNHPNTGSITAQVKNQDNGQKAVKENKKITDESLDNLQLPSEVKNNIAKVEDQNKKIIQENENPEQILKTRTFSIDNKSLTDVAAADIKTPSEIINKNPVTSALASRKTDVDATAKENDKDVASGKGSVKGFLRKTTRLIEKKTGIDPTNDGELLIGAVAINLN